MPAAHDVNAGGVPSRRKWLWLITVVVFFLLGKLSWWQWQRAEDKQQTLQRVEQLQMAQTALADIPNKLSVVMDGARVTGLVRWVQPYLWLLDNQQVRGQVGYDVVIPVQSADGAGPVVLVNLGWLAGRERRQQLPAVEVPQTFQLNALLRVAPAAVLLGQNVEQTQRYPQRIQAIVPSELGELSALGLLDAVLYQQQSDFIYHYQPVTLPPERHRAYAVQWALLALAVLVIGYLLSRSMEE